MAVRDSKRKYSTGRKVMNYFIVYLWVGVMALGILLLIYPSLVESVLFGLVLGTGLFMFSAMRIFRRATLKTLYDYKGLSVGKKLRNILSGSFFFNLMFVASVLYYLNVYAVNVGEIFDLNGIGQFYVDDPGQKLYVVFQSVVWIIPILFYSMLVVGLLLGSVRDFFIRAWRFFWRYVTVFIVFQIIMFAITAVACVISLLLARTSIDGTSIWFVFVSYFGLSLKAPLEEIDSIITAKTVISLFTKGGTLVSALTGAASYCVLSDIATEHMWDEKDAPFGEKLGSLFKDTDTKVLIIMTVLNAISSIMLYGMVIQDSEDVGKLTIAMCIILLLGWIVSWGIFLKETKVAPYILTFVLMYFVETVVADPTLAIMTGWGITAINAIMRIIFFSFVASMIAYFAKFFGSYGYDDTMTAEDRENRQKLMGGSIFDAISVFVKLYKA